MTAAARSGFSLIELMVTLSLGLAAMAAVGKVFQATARSHGSNLQSSATQDNLRFGMAQIARDIEMAGFFAGIEDPGRDIVVPPETRAAYSSARCTPQWLFDDLGSVDTVGNIAESAVATKFPCVQAVQPGSDVLAIKRVLGRCEATPAPNRFYLITSDAGAFLEFGNRSVSADVSCVNDPAAGRVSFFQYAPTIWHIGNDQGVPSLCREMLSGSRMVQNCVAQGIEDLQLEFGLDQSDSHGMPDGVADFFHSFDSPPDDLQRRRIVAVRVHLLGRSIEKRRDRTRTPADHHYLLGNRHRLPGADGYFRKSLSAVIPLRNPARRISPVAVS